MKKVMLLLFSMVLLCFTVEAQFESMPVDVNVGYQQMIFSNPQNVVIFDQFICFNQVAAPLVLPMQSKFTNYDITVNYFVLRAEPVNYLSINYDEAIVNRTTTWNTRLPATAEIKGLYRLDVGEFNPFK